MELLVARDQNRCQEICSRMFQVPIEQGTTYKEGRRITFFEDTRRTMERNQYQHYWTITEVKQKEYHCGHCRLIHENNSS